jgi:transcriptional regulator with XRE-family HTH domain
MATKQTDPERGERIAELMAERGYDVHGGVTRLARELGVERGQIYRWKAGEAMHVDNLEALAVTLRTTITWIMSGSGAKHPPADLLGHDRDVR